ncbi:TenA family transcriptional regulator [Aquabacterium sp.]|uniref:TenA family transcriptional regulator n=1 Tax=Aquabacterium sp. TaxID=1872578 RepID=UPI002C8008D2|nr:iron-containing redox enzyme family protein [Aquabacterium sp.]HSW06870.1 iron-containing redox enzyme family protein [Aquabacterium sp.]
MLPFFAELITRTDEDRRAFETHPTVVDAVANGMSVSRYRALLLELYHVVWHFNPVSAAAASRMGDPAQDALQPIRHFLYEHMHEEMGHETWVLNDLEAIGVTPADARAHAPSAFTLALTGYNHWCAERRHPASVLGMLYALEVIASVYGGPFAAAIRESLLLEGDRGVSFIASHASLDAQHMAELRQVMNRLNGDDALAAVVESVRVNFHHFTRILESV